MFCRGLGMLPVQNHTNSFHIVTMLAVGFLIFLPLRAPSRSHPRCQAWLCLDGLRDIWFLAGHSNQFHKVSMVAALETPVEYTWRVRIAYPHAATSVHSRLTCSAACDHPWQVG